MSENRPILTGNDAGLLSRALAEIKTKIYEESEACLDDTQALDALLSSLRTAERRTRRIRKRHEYLSPLGKRLMLGTIIGRQGDTSIVIMRCALDLVLSLTERCQRGRDKAEESVDDGQAIGSAIPAGLLP